MTSVELVLAGFGALIAHQLGYGAAGLLDLSFADPGHEHLRALFALLTPLAFFLSGLTVLRFARRRIGSIDSRRLLMLQVTGFLALELSEYASSGSMLAAFQSPAVWLGLAAQPLIAGAIARALRRAISTLTAVLERPLLPAAVDSLTIVAASNLRLPIADTWLLPRRRGPPR